jgi:hypothetical protein
LGPTLGLCQGFDDEPFDAAQGRLREEEKSRTIEKERFLLAKTARRNDILSTDSSKNPANADGTKAIFGALVGLHNDLSRWLFLAFFGLAGGQVIWRELFRMMGLMPDNAGQT